MRKLLALLLIAGLGTIGCGRTSQPTPTPKNTPRAPNAVKEGAPQTKGFSNDQNTAPIPSARPTNTAKLSIGTVMPLTVQKGKSEKTTIPIERGHDAGDVTVVLTPAPDSGITVEPMSQVLHSTQSSASVTVHVAATAKPGKQDVTIKVHGAGATAASGATGSLLVNVQ